MNLYTSLRNVPYKTSVKVYENRLEVNYAAFDTNRDVY